MKGRQPDPKKHKVMTCKQCQREYKARVCDLNRGRSLHCSNKCAGITRGKIHGFRIRLRGGIEPGWDSL